METVLRYNIKVRRNVKGSYIKQQISKKEINNTKNTKKKYMPCLKHLVLNPFLV